MVESVYGLGLGVELGIKNNVFEGEKINDGLRKRCNDLWVVHK